MSNYFLPEQIKRLLSPIDPARVNKDKRTGNSNVEAYEIKAHLNRVIGFGRWSGDTLRMECIGERALPDEKKGGRIGFWVVYRAQFRLTICAPDGTVLATYTEWATGKSDNQPSLGEAHDMAIKTAESQALKRCAINLGDQFGLGLYNGGKLVALVQRTVSSIISAVRGEASTSLDDLTSHITEPLAEEEALEFPPEVEKVETRTVNEPKDAGHAALVAAADEGPKQDSDIKRFYAQLRARAAATGVKGMPVGDTGLSLGAYIDLRQSERLAAR